MSSLAWRRVRCGFAPAARRVCLVLLLLGALVGADPAWAQPRAADADGPQAAALTGTLARVRRAGVVRLGYREQAPPFSFARAGSTPQGYSIDLCGAIVEEMAAATGGRPLGVEYLAVTPETRIGLVERGEIDLECGATSQTTERRGRVAFSPPIFVTGTRLAVPGGSALRSRADLAGRKVAVARGTTNEAVLRQIVERTGLRTEVVAVDDVAQAFALVAAGGADALASDEVLLLGWLTANRQRERWRLVGELLSFETYGIMFARDDAPLAGAVTAALERLARSRELRWIYRRWFERPLPGGAMFALPMSPELTRAFELLGLPPE